MVLCLLWSLVEIHSQTEYPYVSFMGEALPNHAYVDLSLVGSDDSDSDSVLLQCHTDVETCCTATQGEYRGDWILPGSEETLPLLTTFSADVYVVRGAQRVDLRRKNNADMPSGIYRCDISVNGDNVTSVRESAYVGVYARGGMLIIVGRVCSTFELM